MTVTILLATRGAYELTTSAQHQVSAFGGYRLPVLVICCIVLARLILAPYWIWKEEKERRMEAENQRDVQSKRAEKMALEIAIERDNIHPRLTGVINQMHVGSNSLEVMMFFLVTIKNAGSPTIVEGWPMNLTWQDTTEKLEAITLPQDSVGIVGGMVGDSPFSINRNDFIYGKAINPIPRGGMIRGWIWYVTKKFTIDQLHQHVATVEVKFRDVEETIYSIAKPLIGENDAQGTRVFSGVAKPFDKNCIITKRIPATTVKDEPPEESGSSVYP